ncbi:MAG: Acyltransferase 3 [Nitrospira sp.]|jgi:peptidoglycan/LPS O-acetylase OafA/YrhL|nr:MAG: Acyltransferase 3 [Nitrospira sp.]
MIQSRWDPRSPSANLDCLRAIAVLAVVGCHTLLTLGYKPPDAACVFGVILFFVHTSLVLMSSLERIERTDAPLFSTFYLRRLFRIYPLSIFCVTVIVLFQLPRAPWWPWSSPDAFTILTNLSLSMNLFYKAEVTSVLWSLPLEVQMYVFLPVLYLIGKKHRLKGVALTWIGAVAAALVLPSISGRLSIASFGPCFVAGVATYFLGFKVPHPRLPFVGWLLMIGSGLFLYSYASTFIEVDIANWLLSLWIGLSAPFFVELRQAAVKRIAELIARYSYGIYLTHLQVLWFAFIVLKDHAKPVQYGTFALLGIGVPILLYHLVEHPMIRFGMKLTAGRALGAEKQPHAGGEKATAAIKRKGKLPRESRSRWPRHAQP